HLRVHPRPVRGRRRHPAHLVRAVRDPPPHQPHLCHVSRRRPGRARRRRDHAGRGARPFLRPPGRAMTADTQKAAPTGSWWQHAVVRLGVLPLLLATAVIVFSLLSPNFLTGQNLLNIARQSTFLTMVAMGQMLALLTGGFDLSVGTILAVTSVVGALAMAYLSAAYPDMVWLAIAGGMLIGFLAGVSIGVINGIGVAIFNVSPFMMTLGLA